MTSHSEQPATKRIYRKRSEMTPEQAKRAEQKLAYQRKWIAKNKKKKAKIAVKEMKAKDQDSSIDLVITFNQAAKAYEAKIASLEHQAVQYRTVIDYLESKIDSQRLPK
jgi:CTP synthase (UTP-ammonia lyase)